MNLLFTRSQWKKHPSKFSIEQLDKAEKQENSLIGYWRGIQCYLWKYLSNEDLKMENKE